MRISARQRQIVLLIADGLSDKEIALRLGMSRRTVETHLQRLYQRHGLHSRAELVARWLREGSATT